MANVTLIGGNDYVHLGTKFLVAKLFKSHLGTHLMGDLAPKEVATWHNLGALVGAGFLVPYVPEQGYDRLPPHLYSAVRTRQEAKGLIEKGEAPVTYEWTEPEQVKQSRELVDAEKAGKERDAEFSRKRAEVQNEKFQATRIDPRPIAGSVKPPVILTDAKKAEAEEAADEDTPKYETWKKDDLVAEIQLRNEQRPAEDAIATSGNKDELIDRLITDDFASREDVDTDEK